MLHVQVDLDSSVALVTEASAEDHLGPLGDRITLHLADLFLQHIIQKATYVANQEPHC